jgi:hypothetical protein
MSRTKVQLFTPISKFYCYNSKYKSRTLGQNLGQLITKFIGILNCVRGPNFKHQEKENRPQGQNLSKLNKVQFFVFKCAHSQNCIAVTPNTTKSQISNL